MSSLTASWQRTREHLERAMQALGGPAPADVEEYLAHNELELASDCLLDVAESFRALPTGFWTALGKAYAEMGLDPKATHCRYREHETIFGYVEVRLTLWEVSSTGRRRERPIGTNYRPDWDLGNRTASGAVQINGAPVTVEDAPTLLPGDSAVARLHPIQPEAWTHIRTGMKLNMHEGPHVVGVATVTRVSLKKHPKDSG
jgi:hypothetical protein